MIIPATGLKWANCYLKGLGTMKLFFPGFPSRLLQVNTKSRIVSFDELRQGDAKGAADQNQLSNVETPVTGFSFRYKTLGFVQALCQLFLCNTGALPR
jgi:hypothetical protein